MKTKFNLTLFTAAAIIAALSVAPAFALTAYAADVPVQEETTEPPTATQNIPIIEETQPALEEPTELADTEEPPALGADVPLEEIAETEEEPQENLDAPELPALPLGIGTVIDYNTDPDGRLFYTIMTPDEYVFYLVIDKNGSANNVYFLNAVTVADLLPLAQKETPETDGIKNPAPQTSDSAEQTAEKQTPEQENPQGENKTGMYILIAVVAAVGGVAGWYFKIYRPKQQGAADVDEYDPTFEENENDYTADWGEVQDAPQWDEDGESGDGE